MGAVHGVHLKYVAVSALCAWCAHHIGPDEDRVAPWRALLVYSALIHGLFAGLFVLQSGMQLLGKSMETGTLPWWSYLLWWPFHTFSWLYTYMHTIQSERHGIPVASEVAPGWWIGGRYANWLPGNRQWAATIDLTCEFPESCLNSTTRYLLLRCWDGVPPRPEEIEEAAVLASMAANGKPGDCGDIMVHCAHGRGRSTTVMVACLVRAGVHSDWQTAFEAVKRNRPVCRLNTKMRNVLREWQARYGTTPYRVRLGDWSS
eukprot:scaffold52055_cov39-Tisochrysis_lutea.AAC.4